MIDALSRSLSHLVVRRQGLVAIALLGLTVAATWTWPGFRLEPDMSRLLPEDNPVVSTMRTIERSEHSSRILLIDLRGPDLTDAIAAIERELATLPLLARVVAKRTEMFGENWPAMRESPAWFLPESTLQELAERMTTGAGAAIDKRMVTVADQSLKGLLAFNADPLGLRELLEQSVQRSLPFRLESDSPYVLFKGGGRAVLRVEGKEDSFDVDYCRRVLESIDAVLTKAVPDGSWFYYGDYAKAAHQADRVRQDLARCSVISSVLVGLFLVLSLRRVADPLLVFLPVALALYWSLPLAGFAFGPMPILTVSAAAILIGLGVDFAIHFLVRYSRERKGAAHEDAVPLALARIGKPLLTGLLTTALAFLSMSGADFAGLKIFGWLMAGGLGFCFLATVCALPLVLRWRRTEARFQPQNRIVEVFDRLAHSRRAGVLAGLLAVASVLGYVAAFAPGIEFRSDLDFVRSADDVFFDARAEFEEEIGFSIPPVILLIPEDEPAARTAEAIQTLTDEGRIKFSDGFHLAAPTVRRREQVEEFHHRIEGWREQAAGELKERGFPVQAFALGFDFFDRLFHAEPSPSSSRPIEIDGRFHHRVMCFPSRGILQQRQWEAFLIELDEAYEGRAPLALHPQAMMNEVSRVLFDDLVEAGVITAVLSTLIVVLLAGGLRRGLVALVPCACGFGLTLGFLAVTKTSLNMGNCVAIPLLLGIGVVHGVHLAAHFRQTGDTRLGACGVAIWRSCATSVVGFGSLMAAKVPGISSLGLIAAVGVLFGMAAALLSTPVLWNMLVVGRVREAGEPSLAAGITTGSTERS